VTTEAAGCTSESSASPLRHLVQLSTLSDLLTTSVGLDVFFASRLFEGDTGTVSPSHASSS